MGLETLEQLEREMTQVCEDFAAGRGDACNVVARMDKVYNLFGRAPKQKTPLMALLWQGISAVLEQQGAAALTGDLLSDRAAVGSMCRFLIESGQMAYGRGRPDSLTYAKAVFYFYGGMYRFIEYMKEQDADLVGEDEARLMRGILNILLTPSATEGGGMRAPAAVFAEYALTCDDPLPEAEVRAFADVLEKRDTARLLEVCDNTPLYRLLFEHKPEQMTGAAWFALSGFEPTYRSALLAKKPEQQTQDAFWISLLRGLKRVGPDFTAASSVYGATKRMYPQWDSYFSAYDVVAGMKAAVPARGEYIVVRDGAYLASEGTILGRHAFSSAVQRFVRDVGESPRIAEEEKELLYKGLRYAAVYAQSELSEPGSGRWRDALPDWERDSALEIWAPLFKPGGVGLWLGVAVLDMPELASADIRRPATARQAEYAYPLNGVFPGAEKGRLNLAELSFLLQSFPRPPGAQKAQTVGRSRYMSRGGDDMQYGM